MSLIQFNERAYKFIKGSAVSSIIDALVELLTNADDAYDKGKIKNKVIDIHLNYENSLSVTDQAIGLTANEMENCFLQIGNFTSTDQNRGFFSRGAKDITSLGDVTFESIKNGKYSKLFLNTESRGCLLNSDDNITKDLRNRLKIVNNGLMVTIKLNKYVNIPNPKAIIEHYSKHISLRNILNNSKCNCSITFKNSPQYEFNSNKFNLKYNFPNGNVLLYLSYNLKSYPDADAFFTVSKSDKSLYDTKVMKYCDWGIVISSGKVIHDITSINPQFKFNPHMKSIYGAVHSNYINKLLFDFDKNGASKKNPFPILDPSRVGGLNYNHPFMKELLKIPEDRLNLILQELEIDEDNEYVFYDSEINEIVNQLNTTGDKFIESNDLMKFVENKNSNLLRGIESDRGKFVTVEKNFLHDLNKTKRVHFKAKVKKNIPVYQDPMSKLFNIIGTGDEGNAATDQKDTAKLFKEFDETVMSNVDKEEKQIFCFNNVDGVVSDVKTKEYESQNYQHLKKDNLFVIKFINSTQNRKYEIYQSGQKIILKINVNFPMLKRYFDKDAKINKNYETFKLEASHYLHEIITEGLTRIQLMSNVNRDFIKINNASSSDNFNELFKNYDNYKNTIDVSVDKVIQNIISRERKKIQQLIEKKITPNKNKKSQEKKNNIEDNLVDSSDEEDNDIDSDNDLTTQIDSPTYFEETKIKNNIDDFLIKDKLDKLSKENDKMKKELDQLKKEKQEIDQDFKELKDVLFEDVENKVVKNFKKIDKFFNYKFKTNDDPFDFIRFHKITNVHISPSLAKSTNLDKYNLKEYENNTNTLFYGVFRQWDYDLIDKHNGKKFIFWYDNDANINYENRRDALLKYSEMADVNITGSMIVEKYMQILNVKYNKIIF